MNDDIDRTQKRPRAERKRALALAAGVGVAGLVVGGLTGAAISTAAADSGENTSQAAGQVPGQDAGQDGRGPRGEELTGTTKAKVKAAVEEKYPDATIHRLEKDTHTGSDTESEEAYEAFIVDDGEPLVVHLDEDFKITGTETGGGPGGGGPGGPAGHRGDGGPGGDHDGTAPQAPAAASLD